MINAQLETSNLLNASLKIFKPQGRIDAEKYQELRNHVMAIASTNPEIFVIDLTNVQFIDSRGLGLLITVLKYMRSINNKLILCTPNLEVKMLLSLTNTISLFEIYDDCPYQDEVT